MSHAELLASTEGGDPGREPTPLIGSGSCHVGKCPERVIPGGNDKTAWVCIQLAVDAFQTSEHGGAGTETREGCCAGFEEGAKIVSFRLAVVEVEAEDVVTAKTTVSEDAVEFRAGLADEGPTASGALFGAPSFADDYNGCVGWARGGPPKRSCVLKGFALRDAGGHSSGILSMRRR